MRSLFRKLRKNRYKYKPVLEVIIDKNNLIHNLNEFRNIDPDLKIAPVLKSNAYGHGLVEIAQILDTEKCVFFVVDSYFEALKLSNENIKTPILIIGYTLPENIVHNELGNVAFTITDLEQLRVLSEQLTKPTSLHIKIDTGMHRQGIPTADIEKACHLLNANKNLDLIGLCTHFADADTPSSKKTPEQIAAWEGAVSQFESITSSIHYFHAYQSAGFFYHKQIEANVARLGLGLYGISPSPQLQKMDLKPVLALKTILTSIKHVKKGEVIGYNGTSKAPKDMLVGTIPAGYYEGVDRRLSNNGEVEIKGRFAPIIGRISMNITVIDITDISDTQVGDEVIIISSNSTDINSVVNIASRCETIPYEILIHVPQHLRRVVL